MELLKVVLVPSLDELRSISPKVVRGLEAILWPSRARYIFDPSCTEADDGDNFVAPSPVPGSCCAAGLWRKQAITGGTGAAAPDVDGPDEVIGFVEKTDGNVGLGALTAMPGMDVAFDLAEEADVEINVSGSFSILSVAAVTIGIEIDGVQYTWPVWNTVNAAGGDTSGSCAGSFTLPIHLAAGSHLAKFLAAGFNAALLANADNPAAITVKAFPGTDGGITGDVGSDSFSAENKDAVTIKKGQPVAIHSSGVGVVLADATAPGTEAVGFAKVDIAVGLTGTIAVDGPITVADWTDATGAATLPARSTWYLSTTPGLITTTPPATPGNVLQELGKALSTVILKIEIGEDIVL